MIPNEQEKIGQGETNYRYHNVKKSSKETSGDDTLITNQTMTERTTEITTITLILLKNK